MIAITQYFVVPKVTTEENMSCYNALYSTPSCSGFVDAITASFEAWSTRPDATKAFERRLDSFCAVMRLTRRRFDVSSDDIRAMVMQRWFAPPSVGGPGYVIPT